MPVILSANLIVRDEESMLPACLESLSWVDEIVVVDGGSRDRTAEVASQYGAVVVRRPMDDFASQRNAALAASRGRWILSMDADERVSPPLAREILSAIARERHHGYRIPIHSWIFGRRFRWSGTRGERKLRLFLRQRAFWEGRVHERVRVVGSIGQLSAPIWHFSTPDLVCYRRKLKLYASLAASDRTGGGRWSRACVTFGRRLLWQLGALDGPQGILFAALSAWEEWFTASGAPQPSAREPWDGWPDFLLRSAELLARAGRRGGATVGVCPGGAPGRRFRSAA